MAVNLLDTIKSDMPGSFAAMAGGFLGESGASTSAALTALLPVLVAALARSGATSSGTKGVLAMLANPSVDTTILPNLNSIFAAGGTQANSLSSAGAALASSIFGERLASLTAALGSMSGFIKPSSAQKLVALAAPIALAFLKRFVGANRLSADGLASLLVSQRPFLEGALDGRLTAALGHADPAAMLATLPPAANDLREAAPDQRVAEVAKVVGSQRAGRSGVAQWWPWLAGAVVVLYVLSRVMMLHQVPRTPSPAEAPTSAPTPAPATVPPPTTMAPGSATATAPAPAPTDAAPPTSNGNGKGASTDTGNAKPR